MSPDGRRIVSGSWDGVLKIWDAAPRRNGLVQGPKSRSTASPAAPTAANSPQPVAITRSNCGMRGRSAMIWTLSGQLPGSGASPSVRTAGKWPPAVATKRYGSGRISDGMTKEARVQNLALAPFSFGQSVTSASLFATSLIHRSGYCTLLDLRTYPVGILPRGRLRSRLAKRANES